MPDTQQFGAKPVIEIDGSPLPSSVEPALEEVVVDDHLHLPDMFLLRLRDDGKDVFRQLAVRIGSRVTISATPVGDGRQDPLIVGEVTALEAEYDKTGTHALVRGYDLSHRLCRGRRTQTFNDVTDSDLAAQIAEGAGLDLGHVDATSTTYEHVSQVNVNDWEFLKARAREIGYEVAVVLGKFEWRRPAESSAGPGESGVEPGEPTQLVLGSNLEWFRPRVTAGEQVKEAQVRGWDPTTKQKVVATAAAATTSASVGLGPAELAGTFGNPTYVCVDLPLATQAEADAAAAALIEQIGSVHCEADGVAQGNPKLRAGTAVSVSLAGWPYDGRYTITSSRHCYSPGGYRSHFQVSGRNERSLLGLASMGATKGNGSAGGPPMYGVVIAQVTDLDDPEELGRVKLAMPWLSDTYESWWARVVQLGAGDQRGAVWLPEVDDEVLVAFEHGDVRRPYVIGSLWNGVDRPNLGSRLFDHGAVKRRGFVSKKGHRLVFFDDDGKSGVATITADDGLRISLNQTETTIKVTSSGKVEIQGTGEVSITSSSNVTVEATGKLDLKGSAGVSIDGGPQVAITGGVVKLN
ncbi:MAG: VgrG-related protein [Actinomycetota bacterium]